MSLIEDMNKFSQEQIDSDFNNCLRKIIVDGKESLSIREFVLAKTVFYMGVSCGAKLVIAAIEKFDDGAKIL